MQALGYRFGGWEVQEFGEEVVGFAAAVPSFVLGVFGVWRPGWGCLGLSRGLGVSRVWGFGLSFELSYILHCSSLFWLTNT